jgi:hypothetical protein
LSGHLFQGRYKSFLVQEGDYLLGLTRYVHLNPVRGVSLGRGTPVERRKRLRGFKWSSYGGYAGLSAAPTGQTANGTGLIFSKITKAA